MEDIPSEETSYSVNANGDIEGTTEKFLYVHVQNSKRETIERLYVGDCANYREMHWKMYDCLWQYYEKHGFTTPGIVKELKDQFQEIPIHREHLKSFLERKLLKPLS